LIADDDRPGPDLPPRHHAVDHVGVTPGKAFRDRLVRHAKHEEGAVRRIAERATTS
jgi:hypothetical protein